MRLRKTIKKELNFLNKEFYKWYKHQNWNEQKKFLTQKLLSRQLIEKHSIKGFWKCFNCLGDNVPIYSEGRSYFEQLVYWFNGHFDKMWD